MKRFLFASMLAAYCGIAWCAGTQIGTRPFPSSISYLTGNEYVRLGADLRSTYMAGFLTGLNFGYAFERDSENVDKLNACIKGVPSDQLMAIADDYLAKNPAFRDWQMSILAFNAIHVGCTERGFPLAPR